jgi:dipeptidase
MKRLILLTVYLAISWYPSLACTVFIVGKKASQDGSVMVTHSNDGEFETDPRLVKIPAAEYPDEGAQRPVYFSPETYPRYVGTERGEIPEYYPKDDEGQEQQNPFQAIGYIPQVNKTFAYLEDTYGAVNEMQVGIGESTCSGVFGASPLGSSNGTALFSIDALSQIAMERASTARQAVSLMGDLAEQHGFYGAGQFEGTAESLAVSDPNDAWIFHILPDPTGRSAIWAAQRVPEDGFAVLANMFVIRQLDPSDPENFMMSQSVHAVAMDYGWWHPEDGLLDFTKVYSDGEYAHKYYSGRRVWGAYHLAAPSKNFPPDYVDLQSDPVYPVFTKPDKLLSLQDLFRFHRYTYQGTPFDLSAPGNLAGGPFGSPDRWKAGSGERNIKGNWERPIGLYRTSDTYVVQSKNGALTGAVLWYGPSSALATVFTPFVVGLSDIPTSFRSGHQTKFSRESAFWAVCFVHNLANLKWSYMYQDITTRQLELESSSVALVQEMEEDFQRHGNFDTVEYAYRKNVESIVASVWSLSDELMFKYADGFVNQPGHMSQMVGYPEWWLEVVGFSDGPPPPPTIPKCCHPPKVGKHTSVDRKTTKTPLQQLRTSITH